MVTSLFGRQRRGAGGAGGRRHALIQSRDETLYLCVCVCDQVSQHMPPYSYVLIKQKEVRTRGAAEPHTAFGPQ